MALPSPVPPLAPDELVSTGGERQILETFLDLYRDILKRKLSGLSDQQIRQRHVPSQTMLGGLVKHLSGVEREWFQMVLAGRSDDETDEPLQDDSGALSSNDTAESRSARADGAGLAAVDLRAYDRGISPACRPRRHSARAD